MRAALAIGLLLGFAAGATDFVEIYNGPSRLGPMHSIACGSGTTCSSVGGFATITSSAATADGGLGWNVTCAAGEAVYATDGGYPYCRSTNASHELISATHTDTTGTPAQGDVLYRNGSSQWTKLAAGTSTQVLHSGTTPSWSAVSLTADVSGTLPVANGGTNLTTATDNHVMVGNGTTWESKALVDIGADPTPNAMRFNDTTNAFSIVGVRPTVANGGTGNTTTFGDDQVLVGTGSNVSAPSAIDTCADGGSAVTYNGVGNDFGCISTTVLPTLVVTSPWTTILDCDWTTESNQTISSDTTWTACGETWSSLNQANSSTFAIVNGSGLQITSVASKAWRTTAKTAPLFCIAASDLFSGTIVNPRTPVRAWLYATTITGSATGDAKGMAWTNTAGTAATGTQTITGAAWRFVGANRIPTLWATAAGLDKVSTYPSETDHTAHNVLLAEWPQGYGLMHAAASTGAWSSGFPAYTAMLWTNSYPGEPAAPLYSAGGATYANEFCLFDARPAAGGSAGLVVARLKVEALLTQ